MKMQGAIIKAKVQSVEYVCVTHSRNSRLAICFVWNDFKLPLRETTRMKMQSVNTKAKVQSVENACVTHSRNLLLSICFVWNGVKLPLRETTSMTTRGA